MTPDLIQTVSELSARIENLTAEAGRAVRLVPTSVLDRSDSFPLRPSGLISPNGSCRMIRAKGDWMAFNLPRESDLELIPALCERDVGPDVWAGLEEHARTTASTELLDRATMLGLAVSIVGETKACHSAEPAQTLIPRAKPRLSSPPIVLDLSSLWAGPLCGAILTAAGAETTKLDSTSRPDPTPQSAPLLDKRLNGAKMHKQVDFTSQSGRAHLRERFRTADVVITSARPRAFDQLGLPPAQVFTENPSLIWIAITGHGWQPPFSERTGFGDDAAASGGLVDWTSSGAPHFIGDALADPLTGLTAAIAALEALAANQCGLIDIALAQTAANIQARRLELSATDE